MGGKASKEYGVEEDGGRKAPKFMGCSCGKGRDDKDEEEVRGQKVRLSEEEWAAVKTGRYKGPGMNAGGLSFAQEEAFASEPKANHRKRRDKGIQDPEIDPFPEPDFPSTRGPNGSASGHSRSTTQPEVASSSSQRSALNGRGPKAPDELRFKVGDRVKCVCHKWGNQWEVGSIVKLNYREDNWSDSKPSAPYQVKLDKGALIYAPEDIDDYIQFQDESWAEQLPPGAPWYLQPGALDRELAKLGAYR
mmetsp:Transcript_37000/g.57875  ORF Transcript_37000/g.57875 Transcript_37000/m.57875 type:complete len:248 (-) Transcript_37000:104-847(-)|eukprot:CAMPEP_0184298976 /NCGR_PEP_ID=MMETSP1049-20130417/9687_1 /TAXON_ID=77928 /ORGANISM="Proteomonas sulcata, Strain CCMP704" /LENGTH=247 /DNA_ID=CAMNT_0026609277 /DNA_START=95 /DNA_END=838 /DNA_ORIENTATION=+